jgi:hypothetical protein
MTAAYYNVTNPANNETGEPAFQYLDSYMGARYSLYNKQESGGYDMLSINSKW